MLNTLVINIYVVMKPATADELRLGDFIADQSINLRLFLEYSTMK